MPTIAPRLGRLAGAAVILAQLALGGCATAPDPETDREAYREFKALNDPLEPLNRGIFELNRGLDAMFLRPLADFYRLLLPPPLREGINNILNNLRTPVILANDLLQLEFERAGITTGRFLVNTTLGVGGIADWATDFGLPFHNEDFGQTLAVWGVPDGPFLMLPVLGPSNPRDAAGIAVDSWLLDPIGVINTIGGPELLQTLSYVRLGLTVVDARAQNVEELDDLEKSSLDYYAAVRSLYRQFRRAAIYQGRPPADDTGGPTFDEFPAIPLE